jgi:uncharacterized membrane protein
MIETRYDDGRHEVQYILRPNQSWSWRANVWFLAVLCVVSLSIAISFAARGFWMVLPFSVLELVVLVICLWLCVRRGFLQEVIVLEPRTVTLQKGRRQQPTRLTLERTFDRFFTRFHVERTTHPWRDTRVQIRCRNELHEIGGFLPTEEKQSLIAALRQGIRYVDTDTRQ